MRIRGLLLFPIVAAAGVVGYFVASATYHEVSFPHAIGAAETVRILTASRALAPGQELEPGDLQWVEWPRSSVPHGAFTSLGDLLGDIRRDHRWSVREIGKGEPVLRGRVSELNHPPLVYRPTPPGMRAVSFPVDIEDGDSRIAAPGDRVDVVLVREVDGGLASSVLLQHVEVLAASQPRPGAPEGGQIVTVAVTVEQAQKLAIGMAVGRLSVLVTAHGPAPEAEAPTETRRRAVPPPVALGAEVDTVDPAEEFARLCGPQTQPPLPHWVLHPDASRDPDGRGVCARRIPGVDERPIFGPRSPRRERVLVRVPGE